MLVAVKTPLTEFVVHGNIPEKYISLLKKDFGDDLVIETDSEYVPVEEMEWYKEEKNRKTSGEVLSFYRKLNKFTQSQLAKRLDIDKQYISNMENNLRPISRMMAHKLGDIFGLDPGRFI